MDALLGSHYAIARGNRTEEGVLDANTILVTAPYNVQVNRLQQRLHGKARVGTVDKFQGQEAPVAIHSLTASSSDEAPRGVGFLLEPNRLNVAISRAQCLSSTSMAKARLVNCATHLLTSPLRVPISANVLPLAWSIK